MSEAREQQAVVAWFKLQYPDKIIFAIPNAVKLASNAKNKFAIFVNLKKEGVLPGVSDLFIPVPIWENGHLQSLGLFLEMKDNRKTLCSLSKDQKWFLAEMKMVGYSAEWAAGFDQAKTIIEVYMKHS